MPNPKTLRFGIQSLDRLIGKDSNGVNYGIDLSEPPDGDATGSLPLTSSICLSGPDGTGKSVFSLHMASHYLGDCLRGAETEISFACPKVLYISTDLTYKMALKAWHNFALDRPFERSEPLIDSRRGRKRREGKAIEIELEQYYPTGESDHHRNIVDFIEGDTTKRTRNRITAQVCFVDLASKTAGDDWGFVHRLIATLRATGKDSPRHLIIMDAVEGFETLVGNVNAFGEESSRRSRVAQVMRIAAGKCHLVFVIEEGRDQRFPEEFVTDVVIRLRSTEVAKYLRRTVEIEKARGQSHVRGRHPFVIRDGQGSTTGDQANADEPGVRRCPAPPLRPTDFVNQILFANNLAASKEQLAAYLKQDTELKKQLRKFKKTKQTSSFGLLVNAINEVLKQDLFSQAEPLLDRISEETLELLGQQPKGEDLFRLNRWLLEDCYPGQIAKSRQSYVHIFSSLHHYSRETMIDKYSRREDRPSYRHAAFGIRFLDNMLGGTGERAEVERIRKKEGSFDTRGLPCATTTALIGDSLTQKSQLGRAFLSRAFLAYAEKLASYLKDNRSQLLSQKSKISIPESELKKLREPHDPVAVMFTTRPTNPFDLERDFYDWLQGAERVKAVLPRDTDIRDAFELQLKRFIRQHTICRRFEIHDISAPILMHIFKGNIEKAQRIMLRQGSSKNLDENLNTLFCESWRIRIVIDDLSSFRDTFPEMRDDPLMLPALLFMLNNEGVTSLIIDTQSSGSPELPITERFDSAVRELVETRIYTWRLPFYGESRVAISLLPPISLEHRGVIRELRPEAKGVGKTDPALIVDPHFELYQGLEKGRPEPVPLEVHLYAETDNIRKYIDAEETFLRNVFTPVLSPDSSTQRLIIKRTEIEEYDALRDSCHLQRDTRTDHTTILQVDEFWWLRRPHQRRAGAFRQQWNYLNAVTTTRTEKQGEKENQPNEYVSDPVTDPFGVFQPAPLANADKQKEKRRLDFFDNECGYELLEIRKQQERKRQQTKRQERARHDRDAYREDEHKEEISEEAYIDRIPFTWDFGFLLCNEKAWSEAGDQKVPYSPGRGLTISDVWSRLVKANDSQTPRDPANSKDPISWRTFLAASKVVAEVQSYRTSTSASPFDFTMLMPESFSCLILEMWCSEIFDTLKRYGKKPGSNGGKAKQRLEGMLDRVARRAWSFDLSKVKPRTLLDSIQQERRKSLTEILEERKKTNEVKGFSLELYKVWLLLIESLTFTDLINTTSHFQSDFKSKNVSVNAVSARHWYKTASSFMDSLSPEQLESNWLPVRLPGHFSVRADWFLAVAGGSRSNRLADHALDLLSSQRSNVTRLQQGVGLPTRDLFFKRRMKPTGKDQVSFQLRTRLVSANRDDQSLTNILYDELRKIGACSEDDFHWLWRSRISAYNRQSRIWHKWLCRCVFWWYSWRQRYGSNWTQGFKVYDLVTAAERDEGSEKSDELNELGLQSWNSFGELRDILIAELEEVNIPSN